MLFPKLKLLRSESYRRWVVTTPCRACKRTDRGQCAHSNQAKHGKGMAQKAGDQFTFNLCAAEPFRAGCHQQHDLCLEMTKAERDQLEDRYIAETLALAKAAGRKEIRGFA